MTRRSLLVGGGSVLGGLVVGGLVGNSLAQKPGISSGGGSRGSVKVVGIFPASGVVAADGKEMANGVKLAVEEINARGGLIGYHLDYVEIDDKDSNTDQITAAFNRAVSLEKADVIFSGYHLASGPEFDIVANAGALYYNVNTRLAWLQRYTANPASTGAAFSATPPNRGTARGSPTGSTAHSIRVCSMSGQRPVRSSAG